MESTYDFEVSAPSHIVFKYVSDPNNLLKYVPAFRGLRQLDPNTWELEVKWLFSIKLTVSRMILPKEIDYEIKKSEGIIKISSSLRYIILPKPQGTLLKIMFFYQGPFESIARKQTEEYYKKGKRIFEEDLKRITEGAQVPQTRVNIGINEDLLQMQTIMAKEVSKKELEDIIAKGMIESIGGKVILLLGDEKSIVELSFKDGSVDSTKGDLDRLGDKIKVLMKRTATANST